MSEENPTAQFATLKRPVWLTRLGMICENLVRAIWPLWSIALVALALSLLDVWAGLPSAGALALASALGFTALVGCYTALRRFRLPTRAEAVDRLDRSMPGRPITAALDAQAVGAGDAASERVWEIHKTRMEARLSEAKAVPGDLRVADRDPFALRYVALLLVMIATGVLALRSGAGEDLATGPASDQIATGPSWEIWVEPPLHTGKPTLYLNEIDATELSVPVNSQLTVRLYGEPGVLALSETVSDTPSPETPSADAADSAPQTAFNRVITRDGTVAVDGAAERPSWQISVQGDALPEVRFTGEMERSPEGDMRMGFEASDDYGVMAGTATITLDLEAVDRRFGLATDPEPREEIVVDLPMPFSGDRTEFAEVLIENLAQHPWASLPVSIELSVIDNAEQLSAPHVFSETLPGRRFFQPIAKAVIEMRRDLLWSAANARRSEQILRTITYKPDEFFPSQQAYLTLRRAITRLELARDYGQLTEERRAGIAEMLWNAAVLLEEGSLNSALERLRRAQERLSDAMRDGATDEEIAELMQELNEAMQEYMRQLAQQEPQEGGQQQAQGESMEVTQDQLQQMLDEIQRMMEEGDMEGAEQLLSQLMEMMQNMQIARNQQGQGESPGEQAMQGLQDTLRDQQGLSDEAFRDLQEQLNPNAQAGESQQNEGRDGGEGRGQQHSQQQGQQGQGGQQPQQPGQGQQGNDLAGTLAERQQQLRRQLNRQAQNLPGQGTEEGDAARDALDRAGDAMDRAEDALRDNDLAEAIDSQSDAIEALREGMRNLGEAMAQQQQQNQQGGQQGQADGRFSPNQRDPLGREAGTDGQIGTEENMLGGEAARKRSRELRDELRRRSGEKNRPEVERDYLERLLDQF